PPQLHGRRLRRGQGRGVVAFACLLHASGRSFDRLRQGLLGREPRTNKVARPPTTETARGGEPSREAVGLRGVAANFRWEVRRTARWSREARGALIPAMHHFLRGFWHAWLHAWGRKHVVESTEDQCCDPGTGKLLCCSTKDRASHENGLTRAFLRKSRTKLEPSQVSTDGVTHSMPSW